jgi:hypothetical protein
MFFMRYELPAEHQELGYFLGRDDLIVRSIHLVPLSGFPDISHYGYIFYDIKEKLQQTEARSLQGCILTAREILKDPVYGVMKNQKQRQIYLLSRYGIGSHNAGVLIELLKEEMRAVLEGSP